MVRPNSVLPIGACEERPDYDYTDGLELHAFKCLDGEITVTVPGLDGSIAATYKVKTENGQTTVTTDSHKPWRLIVH